MALQMVSITCNSLSASGILKLRYEMGEVVDDDRDN